MFIRIDGNYVAFVSAGLFLHRRKAEITDSLRKVSLTYQR
jgi:hypothetical protein